MTEAQCGESGRKIFEPGSIRRASASISPCTYPAVDLDLLVSVLVDFPDEVVHLSHQLEVAQGQLVRGHPEHVPHGSKRPGKYTNTVAGRAHETLD